MFKIQRLLGKTREFDLLGHKRTARIIIYLKSKSIDQRWRGRKQPEPCMICRSGMNAMIARINKKRRSTLQSAQIDQLTFPLDFAVNTTADMKLTSIKSRKPATMH